MKITKVMTDDVITAMPGSSLYDVAQLMKEHNIGFIPIVSDKKLLGVVTDRDLAIRGYAEKRNENVHVSEIMTSECVTVSNDASVDEVAHIMAENQIRRICITDNGHLVGVCAIGDLAVRDEFDNEAEFALSVISQKRRAER